MHVRISSVRKKPVSKRCVSRERKREIAQSMACRPDSDQTTSHLLFVVLRMSFHSVQARRVTVLLDRKKRCVCVNGRGDRVESRSECEVR